MLLRFAEIQPLFLDFLLLNVMEWEYSIFQAKKGKGMNFSTTYNNLPTVLKFTPKYLDLTFMEWKVYIIQSNVYSQIFVVLNFQHLFFSNIHGVEWQSNVKFLNLSGRTQSYYSPSWSSNALGWQSIYCALG